MKTITTQIELDTLIEIGVSEGVTIDTELEISKDIVVKGKLIINKNLKCFDSAHVVAWGSAHVVARGSAHVEARDSAHVEAWDLTSIIVFSASCCIELFGFSVCIVSPCIKIKIKKSKTAVIQRAKVQDYFTRNGIKKGGDIILYKRVSSDFKTQENTTNETLWLLGTIVIHPNWNPRVSECGDGKFHAVSRPYFADEFRNKKDDKYIAIKISSKNLYEWKDNPRYPHKIGFYKGEVLYEVDKYGNKIS